MPTKPHGRNYVDSVLGIVFGVVLLAPMALAQSPELKTGPNADLGGALLMPANDEWNRDISKDPVDPRSDAIIASISAERGLHEDFGVVWQGAPAGIPYYVVGGDQPMVPVIFRSA
jgi:hypothetical protein